jgi:Kinesin-associated microtubule-binding
VCLCTHVLIIARGHVATKYQQHEECLSDVASTFCNSASALRDNVAQTRKSISHNSNGFTSNSNARAISIRDFESQSSENVSVLKKKILKHEILEDIPTSETPKKRNYHIPSSWPATRPHEDILGQMNKMPLSNVDVNLTSQTPSATRVQTIMLEKTGFMDNSVEKKVVTPPYDKGIMLEKITSEGRENTVFKSKLAAPSRKRALGSH